MHVQLVKVDLVVVGTLAADVAVLVADYERRLTRYVRLAVHEVKAEPTARDAELIRREEGARMEKLVRRLVPARASQSTRIVALDSRGSQLTTEQLAELWLGSATHLVLLIGGTMGLAADVLARADDRVAFGRLTLPHQLARLVATEQLYRSYRIARGEPYHF
ncbi:MAG: hypothetical protein JWN41_853 [Thermoleophilia bacterium]|nr:hypothetical protein [Thermoleophilia bacterium]